MRAVRLSRFPGKFLLGPAAALGISVPGPAFGQEASRPSPHLPSKVHGILDKHCYSCHGKDGRAEMEVYILDRDGLIAQKKVVPGSPDTSRVSIRMSDKNRPMPPLKDDEGNPIGRMSAEDTADVRDWIGQGARSWDAPVAPRRPISQVDIFKSILDDLDGVTPQDRRFFRYFTLSHLWNAGVSEDELKTYRFALAKLLNSLSWQKELVKPVAVDPEQTILRVDLRRLGWSEATWYQIAGEDPFALVLDLLAARTAYENTGCDVPAIRADWFVFAGSRPPLYHDILKLPATLRELEARLGVDAARNIADHAVMRAGFNLSGVSSQPRMIELHLLGNLTYTKSYDFLPGGDDARNIFNSPFGPAAGGHRRREFVPDGGEIIFVLPNGMLAFLLVDAAGKRIDQADTKIVTDKNQRDHVVRNGISCFSCHGNGFIRADDEIRQHVTRGNGGGFSLQEVDEIRILHPERDAFNAQVAKDSEDYLRALEGVGMPRTQTEPISTLSRRFEKELGLQVAAAEAGVSVDSLLVGIDRNVLLKRTLGHLRVEGGTVKRDVFLGIFAELAQEVQRGVVPFKRQFAAQIGTRWTYRVTIQGQGGGSASPYELRRELTGYHGNDARPATLNYLESTAIGPIRSAAIVTESEIPTLGAVLVPVKVDARSYSAYRVEARDGDRLTTHWIVPSIGEVRREVRKGDGRTTFELTAVEPPSGGVR